jgi:choline kinase
MKKDVVILAAGLGSRMGTLTTDVPKSALFLCDKPIIVRLIEQLRANDNIGRVIVVVGYLSSVLRESLFDFDGLIFVENSEYKNSNNMWSFCLTEKYLDPHNGLITINADCVYSNEIILNIGADLSNRVYAHSFLFDEEAMKVRVENGFAEGLSKDFDRHDGVYNCIDLYEFDVASKIVILEELQSWCRYKSKGDWFEKGLNYCIVNSLIKMEVFRVNFNWVEIDTEDDYTKAKKIFCI